MISSSSSPSRAATFNTLTRHSCRSVASRIRSSIAVATSGSADLRRVSKRGLVPFISTIAQIGPLSSRARVARELRVHLLETRDKLAHDCKRHLRKVAQQLQEHALVDAQ